MNFNNRLTRKPEEPILIAAHRGISGANIPCNTLAAYNIALMQGADIVELDVSRSRDGVLYAFHPGMEPAHLNTKKLISMRSSKSVNGLRFVNQDNVKTHYHVSTLEEALMFLKGKCYINVDKFWTCTEEISAVIRKCGVENQVIVKTKPDRRVLTEIEKFAPDFMYMPLISEKDTCSAELLKMKINFIGAELLFPSDDSPAVSDEYIRYMHENGLLLWGNSIVYDESANISAHHTDDVALTEDMDRGWGWFKAKGFDIVQTDWVQMARKYFEG